MFFYFLLKKGGINGDTKKFKELERAENAI